MEQVIFTQLSILELRIMLREEITNCIFTNGFISETDQDETGGIELAVKVTGLKKSTIYGLVSKREIPHSKPGKILYFSKVELLNWIKEGKRKTASEIKSIAENYNADSNLMNKVSNGLKNHSIINKKGGKKCFSPSENL